MPTNPQTITWILDKYSKFHRYSPAAVMENLLGRNTRGSGDEGEVEGAMEKEERWEKESVKYHVLKYIAHIYSEIKYTNSRVSPTNNSVILQIFW
ncbi:hypothetical protein L2E82_33092 [Cichorium intybus]|uniref:Uncharacterized protein n=1 Tax=Cichorium intybus TaxID=13427 RepID=A0ACB9BJ83_CICIN|nr:hypothetical protein L2E82_33092 [Cichorium intybus]